MRNCNTSTWDQKMNQKQSISEIKNNSYKSL